MNLSSHKLFSRNDISTFQSVQMLCENLFEAIVVVESGIAVTSLCTLLIITLWITYVCAISNVM